MSVSAIPLVSVEEAAEKLDLSVRRVQKLCEEKRLGQKVGQIYVIPLEELKSFAKKPRNPGRPKDGENR